jgi:glycosyltransferase involved in cell wall biosynthesis
MRIVHIEDFFHPWSGYQVNILSKYQAKMGNTVTVITSKPDKLPDTLKEFFNFNNIEEIDNEFYDNYKVKVIRINLYAHLSGRSIYYEKVFKLVDDLKPDILYVHGNDTYIGIRYILKSNKLKYPVITDNHMVEMASENRFRKIFRFAYRHLITRKIVKNKIPVIRMSNDNFVQLNYNIPKRLTPTISFGSDLMLFHPDQKLKYDMRRYLNVPLDSFIILYAGKLDESKGGMFFAEAIRDKIVSSKEILFVIIGNFIGDYGARVKSIINLSENRVICFPTQKYADLA